MTQFEFAEAFSAYVDTSLSTIGLYITAVTGYLIAAYLVGEKLTRSQLTIVSALFVVFATVMAFAGFSLLDRAVQLEVEFEGSEDILDNSRYLLLLIEMIGIFAALKFMMDIRKSNRE